MAKDPKLVVRDLISNNWNTANTSINDAPRVHTGWYNGAEGWGDTPQISVTNANENPLGGGNTGFSAIKADGSTPPIKHMLGFVDVVCWAHQDMYDGVNAKTLIYEFSEEVKRIIKDNLFPSDPDIDWLSWAGRTERVDLDAEPILFRYDCEVRYFYKDD